jgi:hypothetical protein
MRGAAYLAQGKAFDQRTDVSSGNVIVVDVSIVVPLIVVDQALYFIRLVGRPRTLVW